MWKKTGKICFLQNDPHTLKSNTWLYNGINAVLKKRNINTTFPTKCVSEVNHREHLRISMSQHEQWRFILIIISHVFSITCIACCNVLWHNWFPINLKNVFPWICTYNGMSLQNDSPPRKSNILINTTLIWKMLCAGWTKSIPAQQIVESNDTKMLL